MKNRRKAPDLGEGSLIYLNEASQFGRLEVWESPKHRWLQLDGVTQTIQDRQQPWKLPFPHQKLIARQLDGLKINRILEFGLGGGSFAHYFRHYWPGVEHLCIEQDPRIIQCFGEFFDQGTKLSIQQEEAAQFVEHYQGEPFDLILLDIYDPHDQGQLQWPERLLDKLSAMSHSKLFINCPDPSAIKMGKLTRILKQQWSQVKTERVQGFCNKLIFASR
ncbi:spermidine synthase [Dongshaea marina]|uniref:spermidine synthase n=1 Tax=Dongshaea marina TaxID=2047966 RepID=UPI000D3ED7EE|nr:hypothetical protein [Dongshaea marina]